MSFSVESSYFTTTGSRDLFDMIVGEKIATGSSREVYTYRLDPTKVIKVEVSARSFQNILEWEAWENLKDTSAKKFLAPCFQISATGIWLIQARTEAPSKKYKWPKQMPRFLTDHKHQNYGLLNGRLVCHDYGLRTTMAPMLTKPRKVTWWDDSAG